MNSSVSREYFTISEALIKSLWLRYVIKELYHTLLKKRQLGEKALASTTYQRGYFLAFNQDSFDRIGARHFAQVPGRYDYRLTDFLADTIKNRDDRTEN